MQIYRYEKYHKYRLNSKETLLNTHNSTGRITSDVRLSRAKPCFNVSHSNNNVIMFDIGLKEPDPVFGWYESVRFHIEILLAINRPC